MIILLEPLTNQEKKAFLVWKQFRIATLLSRCAYFLHVIVNSNGQERSVQ